MSSKEVTLQTLRLAIVEGASGDYVCAFDPDMSLDAWSWQARELEAFAKQKGYRAQVHPTATGGADAVDLLVVRIK